MDIVERLRDPESMYDADDVDLHLDAVDEIERLRGIINDDRLEGAADKIERLREQVEFERASLRSALESKYAEQRRGDGRSR